MGIYQGKDSFPTGHFDTSITFFRVARNYVAILPFERLKLFLLTNFSLMSVRPKTLGPCSASVLWVADKTVTVLYFGYLSWAALVSQSLKVMSKKAWVLTGLSSWYRKNTTFARRAASFVFKSSFFLSVANKNLSFLDMKWGLFQSKISFF